MTLVILGPFFGGGGAAPPLNLDQSPHKSFCVQFISVSRLYQKGFSWGGKLDGILSGQRRPPKLVFQHPNHVRVWVESTQVVHNSEVDNVNRVKYPVNTIFLRQKSTTATKQITFFVESGEDIDHGVRSPLAHALTQMIGCATIGCTRPIKVNLGMILRKRIVHGDVMICSREFVRKLSMKA